MIDVMMAASTSATRTQDAFRDLTIDWIAATDHDRMVARTLGRGDSCSRWEGDFAG